MEIEFNTNIQTKYKANNKQTSQSLKQSFKDTLNIAKTFISSFDPLGNLSDNGLKAIKDLEKILNTSITNDNFKSNGYLDIMNLLRKNDDKISHKDIKKVRDILLNAVRCDVIEIKDYYAALQWLKMKDLSFRLKEKSTEEIIKIMDKSRELSESIEYKNKTINKIYK